jgi:hypothetical protein
MALESWAKFAKPDEEFDMTEAPSEAFDRQEFVVLMGEAPGVLEQKFLPIIRTDAGGFFGFGEPNLPHADKLQGRFAQLLPTKVPDDGMRLLAKTLLKVKGVVPARRGTSSRLPPARR